MHKRIMIKLERCQRGKCVERKGWTKENAMKGGMNGWESKGM